MLSFTYDICELILLHLLPDCSEAKDSDEPMIGLKELIVGMTVSLMGDLTGGIMHYTSCVVIRENLSTDVDYQHITAFACFQIGKNLCILDVSIYIFGTYI